MKEKLIMTCTIKEVMSNEDFRETYEKNGVVLAKEFYVKNGQLISSIRFMGRLFGVEHPKLDKWHNILSNTNKKRTRNKISNRMIRFIEKQTM